MAGPSITEEDIAIVTEMLRSGWYGKSAYTYVELFEREFAERHDRKFALMTPNCTTALHLILTAIGVTKGDEVVVPDVTWIGSAAAITYLSATTIFSDVNPISWCIDLDALEKVVNEKTKAVICVDLYGNMPDYVALEEFCTKRGIFLIEDAAEAIGSSLNKKPAGSFGDASVFSFHRTKTLSTGEGGMLILNDNETYERCRFLRDHGRTPGSYFNTEVTYKYMPSNLAASLGYAQLLRIDQLVARKREIFQLYASELGTLEGLTLNPEPSNVINSAWSTVLLADQNTGLNRDNIMSGFESAGLPSRPFFYPLSSLPAYGSQEEKFSRINLHSYDLSKRGVCLPSALNITNQQILSVCDTFKEIYSRIVG